MKNHHLKDIWQDDGFGHFTNQEPLYISYFDELFYDFSGSVLEVGPGTGKFAHWLLSNKSISNYTILDIEKNIHHSKETLNEFDYVDYICSHDYDQVFEKEYDMIISIQCLSETPEYYYKSILNNVKASSCFILDGAKDDNTLIHSLEEFVNSFDNNQIITTDMYGKRTQRVYAGS